MLKVLDFNQQVKLRFELQRADSRWELYRFMARNDGLCMRVVVDKKRNRLVLVQQLDCQNVVEIDTQEIELDVSNEKKLNYFLDIINKEQPFSLGKVNFEGSLRKTLLCQYKMAIKKFGTKTWDLFLGGNLNRPLEI